MKMASRKTADQKKKAALAGALLIAVLVMTRSSVALQAAASTKNAELATVAVRRVVISLSDRKLALLKNGHVVKIYRVAVGKPSTPSPAGDFKVVNRVTNPTYYHKGQVITAGKNNPVGSRWMGLSAKSYGIHGTNQPNSIGKAASTGCIRMRKRDLEELFAAVEVGDPVEIRADRDERLTAIFAPKTGAAAQASDETAQAAAGGQ